MIRSIPILIFWMLSIACAAQKAEVVSLVQLQDLIGAKTNSVQVFNFWATWCAPCVKEMPLLEKLHADRKDITVTLVSMDLDLDPNPEKVNRFVARKNIQSRVVMLSEKDPNSWITKIDGNWSGALPATLIVNNATGKRKFVQGEVHEGEIEKWIESLK